MSKLTYAGGFKSISSSWSFLRKEKAVGRGVRALVHINQPDGFDCPGCAWPDPDPTSATEFCENGAKAIAAEATSKKVDAAFFARNSIEELKSWSDYELEQQGRLTTPMYKPAGAGHYEPVAWSALFDKVAQKLAALDDPNEAVFYTSGRTSNEAAFLYQLLGRQFGTNNFPDCSNLCHESSGVALKKSIGIGKGTVQLEDFEKADLILVMGQNPATNHPRMLTDLRNAVRRGARIIAVNPMREAGLSAFIHPQDVKAMLTKEVTELISLYLQPKIGGDMAFLMGVIKAFDAAEFPLDQDFIDAHTLGLDSLLEVARSTDWTDLEQASGLKQSDMELVAEWYHQSNATIICWAMGLTQHKYGVATIQQAVNLLLLKGNIGKPGAGVCPVRGHSNVQGDRTVGIVEKPSKELLDGLQKTFGFAPPTNHGYDSVATIEAMGQGKVKVFMGMGGNFISATPDTNFTIEAMGKVDLTLHVSTKLNRSHLITGKEAFILPTLGRTELDQAVTVEDSMSMVHASTGRNAPISDQLMSEPQIVCEIGSRLFADSKVPWKAFGQDYSLIRSHIEKVINGFKGYNDKIKTKGGFHLVNSAAQRIWNTANCKANFMAHELPEMEVPKGALLMMTVRSHDQYNTTIYGLNDRYRGVENERMVILMNKADIRDNGLRVGQTVKLSTIWHDNEQRSVTGFKVKAHDIAPGCIATYFPETNVLVPRDAVALESNTPMSKWVPVQVTPATT